MAEFDFSHFFTLLAGAVLASAAFLGKRLITGAKAQERVALFAGLADISAKMKQHGLSVEDVNSVAAFISSKRHQGNPLTGAFAQPPAVNIGEDEPEGYWTQAAMNLRSAASYRTANAQLEEALLELEHFADPDDLRRVQDAWEVFRDQQAEFTASQYAGGTVVPLIRASEAEALTRQRLDWARAEVEERRKL